jgi:hypothetical protein
MVNADETRELLEMELRPDLVLVLLPGMDGTGRLFDRFGLLFLQHGCDNSCPRTPRLRPLDAKCRCSTSAAHETASSLKNRRPPCARYGLT